MKLIRNSGLAHLQKELELKTVPQAIEDRLQQVYAQLPAAAPVPAEPHSRAAYEEVEPVVVRRMPWPLRGAVALCAAVLAVSLFAFGLQLTGVEPRPGFLSGGPTQGRLNVAEDAGYTLAVTGSSCDGQYLSLTCEVQYPESAEEYLWIEHTGDIEGGADHGPWNASRGDDPRGAGFKLLANGQELLAESLHFSREEGKTVFNYSYNLQGKLDVQAGQDLSVQLSLENLYGVLSEDLQADRIPVHLQADFTVPVAGYALTVTDPFSDGEFIRFNVEIQCPNKEAKFTQVGMNFPQELEIEAGGALPESLCKLFVNDTEVVPIATGVSGSVQEGKVTWELTAPVPEEAREETQLSLSLSVDALHCTYEKGVPLTEEDVREIPLKLTIDFNVPVDISRTLVTEVEFREQPMSQDNGISVLAVKRTAEYTKVTIEAPFWGWAGQEVLYIDQPRGIPNACYLYTEDGQWLKPQNHRDELGFTGNVAESPQIGERLQHTLAFDPVPEGCRKVKLQIFDNNDYADGGAREVKFAQNAIMVELTIDLDTGEAVPTDSYLAQGCTKFDMGEYLDAAAHLVPDITGKYFVRDIRIQTIDGGAAGWTMSVEIASGVEDPRLLEVRLYNEWDELAGVMTSYPDEMCTNEGSGSKPSYQYQPSDREPSVYSKSDASDSAGLYESWGFHTGWKWSLGFMLSSDQPTSESNGGFWSPNSIANRIEIVDKETGAVLASSIAIGTQFDGPGPEEGVPSTP